MYTRKPNSILYRRVYIIHVGFPHDFQHLFFRWDCVISAFVCCKLCNQYAICSSFFPNHLSSLVYTEHLLILSCWVAGWQYSSMLCLKFLSAKREYFLSSISVFHILVSYSIEKHPWQPIYCMWMLTSILLANTSLKMGLYCSSDYSYVCGAMAARTGWGYKRAYTCSLQNFLNIENY